MIDTGASAVDFTSAFDDPLGVTGAHPFFVASFNTPYNSMSSESFSFNGNASHACEKKGLKLGGVVPELGVFDIHGRPVFGDFCGHVEEHSRMWPVELRAGSDKEGNGRVLRHVPLDIGEEDSAQLAASLSDA